LGYDFHVTKAGLKPATLSLLHAHKLVL